MLDVRCWMLDRLLWKSFFHFSKVCFDDKKDVGCWMLDFGCWILEFGSWNLDLGIWILEFGIWNLDLGISLLLPFLTLI